MSAVRHFNMPLPGDRMAILQVPYELTEADADFILGYAGFLKATITGGPLPLPPAPIRQRRAEEPEQHEQPAAAEGGAE